MARQAPTYYVAIRRKLSKTTNTPATKKQSPPRKPRPAGRKKVRPEAILAAYRDAAVVFKKLPTSRTRDLVRLAMSLAQNAATALDPHTADIARAKANAAADKSFKELVSTSLAAETTSAMMKLAEALRLGSSRGARVRGDRGVRPRPSHESIDISALVTSFSFEDRERKVDKVTITVDNFLLDQFDPSGAQIKKGDVIEYAFGYADGVMSPIREAVVKKVTGGLSLNIEAHSKDVLMDKVKRRKVYRNVTRSEVVQIIADRNGYTVEQQAIERTGPILESISQSNLTDAQFLRKLANRQGFEFYVDYDGFHWHERNVSQAPIRTFIYYTDEGEGDILDWEVTNDITRRPGRVRVKAKNPDTGEEFVAEASDATYTNRTALQPTPQTEVVLSINGVTGQTKWEQEPKADNAYEHDEVDTHAETMEEAQIIANKRFRKSQQVAVKLRLEVVGDPQLVAKSVVMVERLGGISGRYYVKNVTHTIGGDYKCEVELITDGFQKRGKGKGKGAEGNNALGVALEQWLNAAKLAEAEVKKATGALSAGILSRASKGILAITAKLPLNKESAQEGARIAARFMSYTAKQGDSDAIKNAVVAAGAVMRQCKLIAVAAGDSPTTAAKLNKEPVQGSEDILAVDETTGAVKR